MATVPGVKVSLKVLLCLAKKLTEVDLGALKSESTRCYFEDVFSKNNEVNRNRVQMLKISFIWVSDGTS